MNLMMAQQLKRPRSHVGHPSSLLCALLPASGPVFHQTVNEVHWASKLGCYIWEVCVCPGRQETGAPQQPGEQSSGSGFFKTIKFAQSFDTKKVTSVSWQIQAAFEEP